MTRKASSLTAIVAAAAVVALPVSGAVAATTEPVVTVATTQATDNLTPATVLQDVSSATGAAPQTIVPLVVATSEAVPATLAAPALAASAEAPLAVALPDVPQEVIDALDLAGLPLAGVWNVVEVGQGIYTVFYDLLTDVPNAVITGEWGTVPGLLTGAVADTITWITTGEGPAEEGEGEGEAAVAAEEPTEPAPGLELPDLIPGIDGPGAVQAGLDLAGLPVFAAWKTVETGQRIYSNGYGLLSSVPNAILTGEWGSVPTLIGDAIRDSIDALIELPTSVIEQGTTAFDDLIDSLTPDEEVGPPVESEDDIEGEPEESGTVVADTEVIEEDDTTDETTEDATEATGTPAAPEVDAPTEDEDDAPADTETPAATETETPAQTETETETPAEPSAPIQVDVDVDIDVETEAPEAPAETEASDETTSDAAEADASEADASEADAPAETAADAEDTTSADAADDSAADDASDSSSSDDSGSSEE